VDHLLETMPTSRRSFVGLLPGALLAASDSEARDFQLQPTPLFMKEGGRLKRMLSATIRDCSFETATVSITAAGRRTEVALRNARRSGPRVLLPIDPPEQDTVYECVYRDDRRTREARVRVDPEKLWKLFVVHNSHQDPGFLKLPSEFRAEFLTILDEAVDYCERLRGLPDGARFKWNIEVSYLLEDYRKARSERAFRKVIELLKSGMMEAGAFYCSIQSDPLSLEVMERLVHHATALGKDFGFKVQAAILDDVPGFSWGMAGAMARAGVRYLLFSGNRDRSNLDMDPKPYVFYCEGPGGDRILVFRSFKYHEGMNLTNYRDKPDLTEADFFANMWLKRYRSGGYPYDAALLHACYDFVHPHPELSTHVEAWNRSWEYPRLRVATISEYYRYMEEHYAREIPVLRGGFTDAWNDQKCTMAQAQAVARYLENALPDAEKWAAMASACGAADADFASDLASAYHRLLLFEEHTIGWAGFKHDIYLDETEGGGRRHYREKVAHVEEAGRLTASVRTAALAALGGIGQPKPSGRLAVWNALSWNRTDLVRAPLPGSALFTLHDGVTRAVVPHQEDGNEVVFVAKDVPSVGYRTYRLSQASAHPTVVRHRFNDDGLENDFYRIRIEPNTGGVTSLVDKETKAELVDRQAPHALNQLVYRTSAQQYPRRYFKDLAELPLSQVTLKRGASGQVFASMRISGRVEFILSFEQEVILYHDLKRVDLVTRLRKKPVYTKEGLYLAFPFQITPTIRHRVFQIPIKMDIPGGFMTPDEDQLQASGRDYYIPQHGVLVADTHKSIFWTPVDAPVVEFGGIQSNRYLPVLLGDVNELQNSWIYSYLMHNYWHTNNPIAQGGDFLFRYSLTSQPPNWAPEKAKQFGWGVLSGMPVTGTRETAPAMVDQAGFATVRPENVAITAIKHAYDGRGVILRVAEVAGLDSMASIALSLPGREVRSVTLCDGKEDDLAPATLEGDAIRLHLAPFQVSAVRVLLG
jgi:alpha-mannosidase